MSSTSTPTATTATTTVSSIQAIMPSTVTTVLMPAYTEESPTPPKQGTFLKTVIRGLQVACLCVIPIFAVSLIMFMSVMAIRCDGSGGFVMTRDGTVHCVSSTSGAHGTHGRESQPTASRLGADMQAGQNGTVVMTVTRVVLISVSVLIFSFTAWICVWYQLYGKGNANGPNGDELIEGGQQAQSLAPVATTSSGQMPPVLTIRVNDYLAKEDMERLLGPDHSAAPAV